MGSEIGRFALREGVLPFAELFHWVTIVCELTESIFKATGRRTGRPEPPSARRALWAGTQGFEN